jgi:hypothetical protein
MASNVLSAWPDVDLNRLSTTELMTSISTIDVDAASENLRLGGVVVSKHIRRRLDAEEARLLERACGLRRLKQLGPVAGGQVARRPLPDSSAFDQITS